MPTLIVSETARKPSGKSSTKPARKARRARRKGHEVLMWDRDRRVWSAVSAGFPTVGAAETWLKRHLQAECDRIQHWCRGDTYRQYRVREARV